MKKIQTLIFLVIFQSITFIVLSQDLEFYREDIIFSLNKDHAVTNASYYLCNVGGKDVKIALFYPFPEKTFDLIDSLMVENLQNHNQLLYRKAVDGVFLGVNVKAYGQYAFRVYFRQKLVENHFRYILTSTETWGKPLTTANYELQIPVSLTVDSLSYPPDSTFRQNDEQHFTWKKKEFMPEKDFEVFFH